MYVHVDVKNSTMALGKGRAPHMATETCFVHVMQHASVEC